MMLPRPVPIRTDGSNAFARHTMEVRVPATLQETIDRNPDYPPAVRDALAGLRQAILDDAPLALFPPPAPDHDLWARLFAPHAGERWLDTGWFFAEVYLFRLVMDATRYWTTLRDPFAAAKQDEMSSEALWDVLGTVLARSDASPRERLAAGLTHALWGNRIDLNLKASADRGTSASEEHLLVDDIPRAVRHLLDAGPGDVHVIMDNAGTEQALDFALADVLLDGVARRVVLHVKMHPVFVSDVIVPDVHTLLDRMAARGGDPAALAARLRGHLADGRLLVVPDFFWNTDRGLWELPPRLHAALSGARLVILKGDANYRRATNDAEWPAGTTLAQAAHGFPAPLLALRTLKSDSLVGVSAEVVARLDAEAGPDWRTRGEYGIAELADFGSRISEGAAP